VRVDQIGHPKVREQSIECRQVTPGAPLFCGDLATVELLGCIEHGGSWFVVCFVDKSIGYDPILPQHLTGDQTQNRPLNGITVMVFLPVHLPAHTLLEWTFL
jgi:hypothetical protein